MLRREHLIFAFHLLDFVGGFGLEGPRAARRRPVFVSLRQRLRAEDVHAGDSAQRSMESEFGAENARKSPQDRNAHRL